MAALLPLAGRCLLLLIFPASIQLLLHPVLLHASVATWATYWAYTALGVVLPGTLLAAATLDRRADWLTWLSLGWVIGHALELVSLMLAKQAGVPLLFALWIPVAYGIALARSRDWDHRVLPLPRPVRTALALALPAGVGVLTYFVLNVAEVTNSPPYISDVWYHVNNAHEFRDHVPMQDPRLAGEPLNYHVHGYAIAAAASLVTGGGVLPILVRYAGMSSVFLLSLGLFNVGRAFGRGSLAAGALSALLVVFPIDVLELLLGPRFAFGATYQVFGVHLSTTTVAGHVYLSGLLLLVLWSYAGLRRRDHWALALLAFAGAGAKAMFGPVVICGALGAAGWRLLRARRFERPPWTTAGVVTAGSLPALLPLVLGEGSYSETIRWEFASFARQMPYFEFLAPHAPRTLVASAWILGFSLPLWVGGIAACRPSAEPGPPAAFAAFAWMGFLASLVPALGIALGGSAQLFFLYYGNSMLATIAGYGLVRLAQALASLRRLAAFAAVSLGVVVGLHLALELPFHASLVNPYTNAVWHRASWLEDAGLLDRAASRWERAALGPYGKTLVLSEDARRGLHWARLHLPADAVFAVNVGDASAYAAYSERRAFLETTFFHVRSHESREASRSYFRDRRRALKAWQRGKRTSQMRDAGVTHLFVDRVVGGSVATPGRAVFESPGFAIYELSRDADEPGSSGEASR